MTETSPIIRRFAAMLDFLSRGDFLRKCDEHMETAIETLQALPSEKGTATVTLTFTFAFQGGRLDITPAVKSKLPEDKGFGGTPFWTHEGALSIQHPSQIDMFAGPRSVPRETQAG